MSVETGKLLEGFQFVDEKSERHALAIVDWVRKAAEARAKDVACVSPLYVVYGPPKSGKSTLIKRLAAAGDPENELRCTHNFDAWALGAAHQGEGSVLWMGIPDTVSMAKEKVLAGQLARYITSEQFVWRRRWGRDETTSPRNLVVILECWTDEPLPARLAARARYIQLARRGGAF